MIGKKSADCLQSCLANYILQIMFWVGPLCNFERYKCLQLSRSGHSTSSGTCSIRHHQKHCANYNAEDINMAHLQSERYRDDSLQFSRPGRLSS